MPDADALPASQQQSKPPGSKPLAKTAAKSAVSKKASPLKAASAIAVKVIAQETGFVLK
jgi:hypothetical protein